MIGRRSLLCGMAGSVALTGDGRAQPQATQVPTVAVLSPIAPAEFATNLGAFRDGLGKRGFVEGRNVRLLLRFSAGVPERLPALAEEIAALRPQVIVAGSTAGALAATRATRDIPIVFIGFTDDPVALGVVSSLARPGGNVTGFTLADDLGLVGKRLELLKELMPHMTKVAVLANPQDTTDASLIRFLPAAALSIGLDVDIVEVRRREEFAGAFAAARERGEALFVALSPLFNVNRIEVTALAAEKRLPAIYGFREFVAAGGLMAYGPSLAGLYAIATDYVARILRGESPATLPVQQPTSFQFAINLNAARALGLTVPPSLLARADEVIE